MKRDKHGRAIIAKTSRFHCEDWTDPDNGVGDNLAANEDDPKDDPAEGLNWRDNPVRKEFDNPHASSHRSTIYEDAPSFPENET